MNHKERYDILPDTNVTTMNRFNCAVTISLVRSSGPLKLFYTIFHCAGRETIHDEIAWRTIPWIGSKPNFVHVSVRVSDSRFPFISLLLLFFLFTGVSGDDIGIFNCGLCSRSPDDFSFFLVRESLHSIKGLNKFKARTFSLFSYRADKKQRFAS